MFKIGEVATQYQISNRTLRYWEEVGILTSIRMNNGYRYYDHENILRIKQILMLRKLRLPIQNIHSILVSKESSTVVTALQSHLNETNHESEQLKALGVILERLIELVKTRQSLSDVWSLLDVPDNYAILELKNALQNTLSERENIMSESSPYSKLGDVRIVNLPRMLFACYQTESETPENDCWKVINKLILENSLHGKNGFRHFGFNNPDPKDGNPVYGYEMWIVIPEDFKVAEPFCRKEFAGGLFAAVPTQMTLIGERWKQLWDWVQKSEKYEIDWNPATGRRCLEECLDYVQFNSDEISENDKQLDLLVPIRLKKKLI